ncbi:phospho-N-acetylmuramoyl-pentapeptide-transferase [Lusitaniella coriacea LEGE 07157]|uniref:Phospho-N-acetylmuramoyl-pentapeptide-transferase n=1 Tax=Lusitaniella coriacea LEGE 07157 TaxID=945747 RepID=A0A8J7J5H0_9CYAN|nr:phospho-N-acetylmuramoyl-pentapeptide-transferase [Lusitaniella coriacea]MBE9118024.1 phospho-N-acetylmuramoyl-pentapeptide-transferase [Lusitaniella coriacea LEGE 07157]
MEAKLFSGTGVIKPSGSSLLVLLTSLLTGFALLLDWTNQQGLALTIPLLTCALVSGGIGYWIVPLLQRLKAGQVMQDDGLKSHLKKAGTPTMGGIFFIPVAVALALFWSGFSPMVLAVSAVTLAYMSIGWIDDWKILQLQSNKGISPRMKLALQIIVAAAFCIWVFLSQPASITSIALPLGLTLPLGIVFWIIAGFVLVAESNSTNITDGVDGLASGTCAIALLGLAALISANTPDLALFCACLSGSCLGFIVHNRNPAKVFMGDTGSLALGGALAAVGILSQNLWGLFIISGIFFIESLSVIAQVSYYKATKDSNGKGKRLLRMAPIHHHLELCGWSETQIVGAFYLISFGLAILGILFA